MLSRSVSMGSMRKVPMLTLRESMPPADVRRRGSWLRSDRRRGVERGHDLARAEPQGAVEAVAELGGGVDSEGAVDRGGQVGRPEAPGDRVGAQPVGLADQLAPDD